MAKKRVNPEEEILLTELGKRLAELRKQRGLTINRLGHLSGVHASNIGKIELGELNLTYITLYRILRALNFKAEFISLE